MYEVSGNASPYESDPPKFKLYAYSLSREDGSERWRRTIVEQEGGVRSDATRSPTRCLGPNNLYVVWGSSSEDSEKLHFASLSRENGEIGWQTDFPGVAHGGYYPVVHDGVLYVFTEGQVLAVSTSDGSEKWSREISPNQLIPSVGNNAIAVYNSGVAGSDGNKQLTVLNTEDGSVKWTEEIAHSISPIPTIVDDTVYISQRSSREDTAEALGIPDRKIYALSIEDGSEQWTHAYETDAIDDAIGAGGTSFVTVDRDHVYYGLGFLTPEDMTISQEDTERWREQLYTGHNLVALDRSDGSVVWRSQIGTYARVFTPMIVDNDHLYAHVRPSQERENSEVAVIDRENGDVKGSFGPVESHSDIAVADGTLYTFSADGIVAWS
ncbi:outer membrane protein assembly factor BamB family protein [Halostella litorea]|uniref:outer membrane protein assembly factor BamB family protein n=1 Tax=Halostella litorea TaxID=2528831 RepID=UPI001386F44B|nr:PQQ-binding-like beta-propeller repeat protein [Halostella litorea]